MLGLDVTSNYDAVFLCGDLNFRLDKPRQQVVDMVADCWTEGADVSCVRDTVELLLQCDQLKCSLQQSNHYRIHMIWWSHFNCREDLLFGWFRRQVAAQFQGGCDTLPTDLQVCAWQ